jgi:hypothetical protein
VVVAGLMAAGVGVVVASPVSASASVVGIQRQSQQPTVLAPRPGQVVRGDVVQIAVRAGVGADALSTRLNGHGVAGQFGPDHRGVRTLEASLSDGLRRGVNVLEVTARPTFSRVRRATIRFTVSAGEPLVGAGRDRRVIVGERVQLDGRAVSAGPGNGAASVHWQVVASPGGDPSASAARLRDAADRDAVFAPERPGEYTLKLTDRTVAGPVSDEVRFTAVPASPMVAIDTMVDGPGGAPGIRVGGTTYAAAGLAGDPAGVVQVLVLDRQSLGFVSNASYTNGDEVAAALGKLDDGDLVIVALQKPGGSRTQPLTGEPLTTALAAIGFPSTEPTTDGPVTGGDLSVIGVPGMSPGDADIHVDSAGGAMRGYLSPDQHLEYGFVAPELIHLIVAGATPPCDSNQRCNGGFEVSKLSATTGQVLAHETFITNPVSKSATDASAAAVQMSGYLASASTGQLIEIQTLSQASATGDTSPAPVGNVSRVDLDGLAGAVASVGGTRNGFNREALKVGPAGGEPLYSLIGWPDAGAGHGIEAAADVDGVSSKPHLEVLLRRDHTYVLRPVQSSGQGAVPATLQQLVLGAPGAKAWPLSGDLGDSRALGYLGALDPRLGCDPRSAYWTQGLTEADTNSVADTIRDADMPTASDIDPCTGKAVAFDASQFTAARRELLIELKWVGNVRSYLSKLGSPFVNGALTSWTDAQSIADKVYAAASSPDADTALRWTSFTQTILNLLGPFTGGVTSEIASVMDFGTWLAGADANGSPTDGEVRIKADQLGAELVNQAQQSQATLDRVGDILVSDYAKLSTLGPVAGCNPTSAACNPAFAFSEADKAAASTAFVRGIERIAYEKLMPLDYHVFLLNRYPDDRADRDHNGYDFSDGTEPPALTRYECTEANQFDATFPPLATTYQLSILDPVSPPTNQWNVLVFAESADHREHPTPPPDRILHRMFDPVSRSLDPSAGGLGVSPTAFMSGAKKYAFDSISAGQPPGDDPTCTWAGNLTPPQ